MQLCMRLIDTKYHWRAESGQSGLKNTKRKPAFIDDLKRKIELEKVLTWPLIESFLNWIVFHNSVLNEEFYDIFDNILITNDQKKDYTLYSITEIQQHCKEDVIDRMITYFKTQTNEGRIASLKLLLIIAKNSSNKKIMVLGGHMNEIVKLLVLQRDTDTSWDIPKLLFMLLEIVYKKKKNKKHMIISGGFELIVKYLKDLKKLKIQDKEKRKDLLQVRNIGALLLLAFHKDFYDKNDEVTTLMCNLRTLSLLVDGAKREVYKLHEEIPYDDVDIDEHNEIYSSVLCIVYQGVWNGKSVAVKVFDPNGMGFVWESFIQEISLMSLIKHPNICPFYGACTDKDRPFLVLPYFPRGSLKNIIEHEERMKFQKTKNGIHFCPVIDTSLIVNMTMNAANGIVHLHKRNIIHRDIKAANFLVDEHLNVFVIDFGVSRVSPDDPGEKQTIVGTPVWMAPEVLNKEPYSHKADTYSLALVLWGMLSGVPPYSDIPFFSLPYQICIHKYREKIPTHADPRITRLITSMWDHNPDKRPDFNQILDLLYYMKDEKTGHYYCRVHDDVPDSLIYKILGFINHRSSVKALGTTSKRFDSIVKYWDKNIRHSRNK